MWNKEGSVVSKKLLAEQKYLGEEDNLKHFKSLLTAFKDKRYLRHEGRLVFVIYKPLLFEKVTEFITLWRKLAQDNGLNDFYFIGYTCDVENEYNKIINLGFDAVNDCGIVNFRSANYSAFKKVRYKIKDYCRTIFNRPEILKYQDVSPLFINTVYDSKENVLPTLIPNWDHTPRSGTNGYLFEDSRPEYFALHLDRVKQVLKPKKNQICFLKSWNEWGEGNYVEPDLKYGWGYLDALKKFTR